LYFGHKQAGRVYFRTELGAPEDINDTAIPQYDGSYLNTSVCNYKNQVGNFNSGISTNDTRYETFFYADNVHKSNMLGCSIELKNNPLPGESIEQGLIEHFLQPKSAIYQKQLSKAIDRRQSYNEAHDNDNENNLYHYSNNNRLNDDTINYQDEARENETKQKENNINPDLIASIKNSYLQNTIPLEVDENGNPYADFFNYDNYLKYKQPNLGEYDDDPFDYHKSMYFYTVTHPSFLKRHTTLQPYIKEDDPFELPKKRDPNDTFKNLEEHLNFLDLFRSSFGDPFYRHSGGRKAHPYYSTIHTLDKFKNSNTFNRTRVNVPNSLDPFIYFRSDSTQILQYEIKANKWQALPNHNNFYFSKHFSTAQLPDNSYIITGGELNDVSLNTTHYYFEGNIIELAPMITARKGHNSIYFEGFVYVFGGFYEEKTIIKKCEKYDFRSKSWLPMSEMNFAKAYCNPILYKDRYIYLIGGFSDAQQFEGVFIFLI
jgi:hypothetical protein